MHDVERNRPRGRTHQQETAVSHLVRELARLWSGFETAPGADALVGMIRQAHQLQEQSRRHGLIRHHAYASALLEAFYLVAADQPPENEQQHNIRGLIEALSQQNLEGRRDGDEADEVDELAELKQLIVPRRTRLVYVLGADPRWCAEIRVLLESSRFHAEVFTDYESLASHDNRSPPLAVISELPVPGVDPARSGPSLWTHLQQGRLKTPVIIISERDDFNARLEAIRCGAIRFLPKPVDASALLAALHQLAGEQPETPFRLLLVDDDTILTELYATVLDYQGYRVTCASTPREAIQRLPEAQPDLILLDLYLPICSGIDLAQMIRQYPRFESTPIIFLSVETNLDVQLACARLSGEEFLTKPVEPWRLLMAVESRVHRSRLVGQENLILAERVAYQAQHDALTGLPNRTLFKDRLEQALIQAQNRESHVAVMMLDVDHFQRINDVYGHRSGDDMLLRLARAIQQVLRDGDTLSRPGGDEFMLLLPNLSSLELVAQMANRLLNVSRDTAMNGKTALKLSCSIGIAVSPQDGNNADDLLKHADTALYHAKQRGRGNFTFFTPNMGETLSDQLRLEQDLEQALREQQFLLEYQPIVHLSRGRVAGAEALIRWRHPARGLVPPLEFIPLAERRGLIGRIGQWVIETGCRQLAQWQDKGAGQLDLSVNLSAPQLLDASLDEWLHQCLRRNHLRPEQLTLELTESMLMEDPDQAIERLSRLRQLGVRIAIDDFGTGYSSLSYMKQLPLDRLKVDKSFLDNLDRQEDSQIVRAIIALAHSLGLDVVAEGVETRAQLEHLKRWQCRYYQGYLFSRPTDPDDFHRLATRAPGKNSEAPSRRRRGASQPSRARPRGSDHGDKNR